MYEKAVREYGINLAESYTIGDKIRDCAICEKTNCRGYLISTNEKKSIINDVIDGKYTRIKYKNNLLEAALDIQ